MSERELFLAALQRPNNHERSAFLRDACPHDSSLRERVEALLCEHEQLGSFLEAPPRSVTCAQSPIVEQPGEVIRQYKLMEQIGEGGMGLVFVAEQQHPLRRKVALKIIKPGMDTRQVVARFEAERQALAMMDHQNIAKVLDAGVTDSGRPYFVMELVHGVPITEYCDAKRTTARERLELFVPVCLAIQHAHQKGIIHRDLKPSNVLVTMYDDKPVPKVIDFGVAKAIEQRLTERTIYTQFGALVGTIEYMSPEQAEMNAFGVDTRSDVYSLGVLLYELLTGTTPFPKERLRTVAFDEIRRIIREEEPAKPSTRVSSLGPVANRISARRQSDPRRLSQLLRGELDWIVMKALEKDRNRRYESSSAFRADVERYLRDEPVQACPPSTWYRFGKFARRNVRTLATLAALVVALLMAVMVVAGSAVWAAVQADARARLELAHKIQLKEALYISHTALAGRELAAGNVGRAEELLDDCPPDHRGWEWHFLKRQRYGNMFPVQHHATVTRVVFSPDGRQLATACMDGTFQIRDARTGEQLRSLGQQTVLVGGALVRGMAYSPDSRYLAVTRHDGTLRLWDAVSGRLLHTLEGHSGPTWHVAFRPDSRMLASASSDQTVRLWDIASGKSVGVFSGHSSAVKGVAFRPDGRSVVAACDDGSVTVWDRVTGRKTFGFQGELLAYPYSARFSNDARRLAWSCRDGMVKIWDTTTGRLEINQQSNTHQCRAVAFSPDGTRIALAGFDGTVRLWDAGTGREMLTIFAHPSLVADTAFSHDGNHLASASYDHTVRIWDATPLEGDFQSPHCVTLTGHKAIVSGVAFSFDGKWLASCSWDGIVKLYNSEHSAPFEDREILKGKGHLSGVSFSANQILACGSWDRTVDLWDLRTRDPVKLRTIRCVQPVSGLAISLDGRRLAVGQYNGISVYDVDSGKEAVPFKQTVAPVPALAFTPDGRYLVSAGASDQAIKIWDFGQPEPLFEIRHDSSPNGSVAISPDGSLIASPGRDEAGGDPAVTIWKVDWDAKTHTKWRTLKGHVGYVWKVAFNPNGRFLASGSWDSTIKVWNLEAPPSTAAVTLRGHAGFIQSLEFSPDGQRLASASGYDGHGEVKVWDAPLWESQK